MLKLLEDIHFSSLDRLASPMIQSVILEALFWTIVYLAFVRLCQPYLRRAYRSLRFWKLAKKRNGILMGNGQDDLVLFSLISVHHGTAAAMILAGYATGNNMLFRHGYLCETGFEIADLVAMVLKLYPYQKHDGMKPEIIAAMIFHHTPGIALLITVMQTGLYENEHLQAIAAALLGGAAASAIIALYMYTLDMETQLNHATIVFTLNVNFFVFCRWYIFPTEAWALIQDVQNSPEFSQSLLIKALYAAGGIFSLFNFAITADLIPTLWRYIRRSIDGATPLDTKPIPSSRDSMVINSFNRGSFKGRRSSILQIVTHDTFGHRRRNSSLPGTFSNINCFKHMIEDHGNKDKNDDLSETNAEVTSGDDLSDEDEAALNASLATMSMKKNE